MKGILIVIMSLFLFSCTNSKKEHVNNLVREWSGKEIVFPDSLAFTSVGQDTAYSLNGEYTIVNYIDSLGCTECKLKLPQWTELIAQFDTLGDVSVLFFMHTKSQKELASILKRNSFVHPVCLDENDSFNKLNRFPTDMMFQTFLLDKNSKVVAIGNPVHNPKVKELYLNIISGDKTPKEMVNVQTTVACNSTTFDMGTFDWKEPQIGSFQLTNTGENPLVIIDVATSCGCTSVTYNKEPAVPGKSVELKVHYKADHPEHFNKTIQVHCNVEDSPVKFRIKGNAQ